MVHDRTLCTKAAPVTHCRCGCCEQADVIPACRELGIGIVAYSPLGRGFLTGEQPCAQQHAACLFGGCSCQELHSKCCPPDICATLGAGQLKSHDDLPDDGTALLALLRNQSSLYVNSRPHSSTCEACA
jgi:hypothetical protein